MGFKINWCARCKKKPKCRQTGVCTDCFSETALKELVDRPLVAFFPTQAAPGSEAKIQLMRLRCSLGLPLFNDHDRKLHHSLLLWDIR